MNAWWMGWQHAYTHSETFTHRGNVIDKSVFGASIGNQKKKMSGFYSLDTNN